MPAYIYSNVKETFVHLLQNSLSQKKKKKNVYYILCKINKMLSFLFILYNFFFTFFVTYYNLAVLFPID